MPDAAQNSPTAAVGNPGPVAPARWLASE